jgi:uncharacterized membrane protein YfcA
MSGALASALVIAAGAAVGGFVQELTGFAFSVVALSFWAWALPPQTAAPLAVFGALLGQLASLVSFRGGFEWRLILPLVVGGCLGVPLGVFFFTTPIRAASGSRSVCCSSAIACSRFSCAIPLWSPQADGRSTPCSE